MRYAGINKNDFVNGHGICVSFWAQGCPHRCSECHNPETWDYDGGFEYTTDIKWEIIKAINENNILRNFSVLGGEPMAQQNLKLIEDLVKSVRTAYPTIKIFLWTGYSLENLKNQNNPLINSILSNINFLIDGLYLKEERNLSLLLRGSNNQKVWLNKNNSWIQLTEEEIKVEKEK